LLFDQRGLLCTQRDSSDDLEGARVHQIAPFTRIGELPAMAKRPSISTTSDQLRNLRMTTSQSEREQKRQLTTSSEHADGRSSEARTFG